MNIGVGSSNRTFYELRQYPTARQLPVAANARFTCTVFRIMPAVIQGPVQVQYFPQRKSVAPNVLSRPRLHVRG